MFKVPVSPEVLFPSCSQEGASGLGVDPKVHRGLQMPIIAVPLLVPMMPPPSTVSASAAGPVSASGEVLFKMLASDRAPHPNWGSKKFLCELSDVPDVDGLRSQQTRP